MTNFKTGEPLVRQPCRNNHPICRNEKFYFFIDGDLIKVKCTKCGREEYVGRRAEFKET